MKNSPSERRLNALLDAAVDAMILIDKAGAITRFNHAAERVFGYGAEEVLGRNVSYLMPVPYRQEHDGYLHRYLHTSEARIIGSGREVVAQRKDGSTFPIDLSVGEFRSDAEHGFVGILRDISQRKQYEAEIRRGSEELRLIFTNTPTPIVITDLDGIVINANRACEVLLGYPLQEMAGRKHIDLIVADERDGAQAQLDRLLTTEENIQRDLRYTARDGQVVEATLYAGIARTIDRTPLLMIHEIVDHRALYAATREAEDLKERLAHAGRLGTLGEMVSGIAHEVNQPLTAIANYANAVKRLLLSGQAEPAEMAAVLEKIGSQAERAGQVIRGLRSMVRKHSGERERLDCNTLINEVIRLIDFELRSSGLKLQLNLASGLPAIQGDAVQIQQVVLNLVRNAVDATRERTLDDSITVTSAAPTMAYVEISVSDSGPGISPEVEARLFEPFFTTKPQGMGLGLSICKSIVAAHGGELRYRRGISAGAQFVIHLPTVTE